MTTNTQPCSLTLPQITDELVDQFYPWLIADAGGGYTWNQAAVDFACALKAECPAKEPKWVKAIPAQGGANEHC